MIPSTANDPALSRKAGPFVPQVIVESHQLRELLAHLLGRISHDLLQTLVEAGFGPGPATIVP